MGAQPPGQTSSRFLLGARHSSGAIFARSTKTRDWSRAPPAYIACSSTQAIMAMPITDTNQASVRSQGMPTR